MLDDFLRRFPATSSQFLHSSSTKMNQIDFPKTWNVQLLSTIILSQKKQFPHQPKLKCFQFSKFQIASKQKKCWLCNTPHICFSIWVFPKIGVCTPKSSTLIGLFHYNKPSFFCAGVSLFLETPPLSFSTSKSCHWRNLTSNLGGFRTSMISCAKGLCLIALETFVSPGRRRGPRMDPFSWYAWRVQQNPPHFLGGWGVEHVFSWISAYISIEEGKNQPKKNPNHHDLDFYLRWYDYDIESRMEMAVLLQMLQLSFWGQKNISLRWSWWWFQPTWKILVKMVWK